MGKLTGTVSHSLCLLLLSDSTDVVEESRLTLKYCQMLC